MGWTGYDSDARTVRAASKGYHTKAADDIFVQNRKREIHESMEPSKVLLRESRDSELHPVTTPIIVSLDLTGSMGKIPLHLIQDGLPHMVETMVQKGVKSPAILFLGIGDHETDSAPLQVGQFESGDEELDLWLTRTWIEGRGGANDGESYLLSWYFAAKHTVTDSMEKRGEKGFLFTIGDEPCLKNLPVRAIEELMGSAQAGYTAEELLEAAQEFYHVFHLHIMEGSNGKYSLGYWQKLLGQHCIQVDDHTEVSTKIAETVASHVTNRVSNDNTTQQVIPDTDTNSNDDEPQIMLQQWD